MWQSIVFKSCDKYINSTKMVLTDIKICFMWKSSTIIICAILLWMSKWNFLNGKYKYSQVHCPILHNRKFSKSLVKNFKIWLSSLKRFSIYRTLVTCTVTIQILCLPKGMILLKREDGFFPEREDLPLLEVTAETGLWYRLSIPESL